MTNSSFDTSFKTSLGQRFNRLNREILVADQPETWKSAIGAMSGFVDQVEQLLISEPELVGTDLTLSSRIFRLLLILAETATQGRLELYKGKDYNGKTYQ